MTAPAKYLFDLDFAPGPRAPKSIAVSEHQAQVADAEMRGYRNGFAAAQSEAAADAAHRLATTLEQIARQVEQIGKGLAGIETQLAAESIDVAMAVARKLAPALIAQEPMAEIIALVSESFRHLVTAPHVVVRVGDAVYPQTHEQLEAISRQFGLEGRLVVLAEPEIADGDCRIEWADGGVTRDRASTEGAIAEMVNRYIAARKTKIEDFGKVKSDE